jgi:hypothetical protein
MHLCSVCSYAYWEEASARGLGIVNEAWELLEEMVWGDCLRSRGKFSEGLFDICGEIEVPLCWL